MTQQLITPKTPGGFVRCLSGLFITKENPKGLTPAEQTVTAILYSILKTQDKAIDKDVRLQLANMSNCSLQVAVNYINKLKSKGVVTRENKLHPVFFKEQIIINGKSSL